LPHAAGELVRVLVEAPLGGRQADELQQLQRAFLRRAPIEVEVRAHRLDDLRADAHGRA